MKKSLFFISVLLFSVSTNPFFCSATETLDPVLDVAGKLLRTGVNYYILPAIIIGADTAGGLTLANGTCPPQVIQDNYEFTDGIPVTFSPVNLKKGVVRISTDVNVQFSTATTCGTSTVWKLDDYDPSSEKYFLTTGGFVGNPGLKTLSNWFKIKKFEGGHYYKLKYCPGVCSYCKVICKDVGILKQNGKRRLVLSDEPFEFLIKRA